MSGNLKNIWVFPKQPGVDYKVSSEYDYSKFCQYLQESKEPEAVKMSVLRWMMQTDLFFLLYFGMGRRDINNHGEQTQFLVDAIREVESGPSTDTIDLWSREHYKSTIITQGKTTQDIITIPNVTIGIFSHTRPIAKDFLRPLKTLFEQDNILTAAFPDVFWESPRKEAPAWSIDSGVCLKRDNQSNTNTLEAWGLVDGMPTSKHFQIRVYDDVVTENSVTTPEQTQKTADAFRLSDNLGTKNGWQRIVGTIYSYGDYYSQLREEAEIGIYPWDIRIKPWYDIERYQQENIKYPVLLSIDKIKEKQRKQGPRIFAAQMELDPTNEEMREFRESWLEWYQELPDVMNKWLFVDPANEQKKESSYTAMVVIGIDVLGNKYLLDMLRDKLNLHERWEALKRLVTRWPKSKVYYEKYGMQSDISYMQEKQRDEGVYFKINEMGGRVSKLDRIRRLQPVCADGRFWLPLNGIIYHGEDLVLTFIRQEYSPFPFSISFDLLDAISRIEDPEIDANAPIQPNSDQDYRHIRDEQLNQYECEDI